MDGSAGSVPHSLRAFALSLVVLLSSATAHVSAGGTLPHAATLTVLLAFVMWAVGPMLRQPASIRRVVLLLVGGETFMHVALLSLPGPHGHSVAGSAQPASALAGSMAGMHHHQPQSQHVVSGSEWLVQWLPEVTGQHASMTAAHLVAAVAVGMWLAAGERAFWTLVCLTMHPVTSAWVVLSRFLRWMAPVGASDHTPAVDQDQRHPALAARACSVVGRRGPPARALWLLGT